MDDSTANIPSAPPATPSSSMSLSNPNTILSGTLRGTQNVGGNGSPQIDSANNRITLTSASVGASTIQLGEFTQNNINGFGLNFVNGSNTEVTLGISVNGTTGLTVVGTNNASLSLGLNSVNEAQLLFNDGSVNRLLIGQNAAGQEVVWVSPSGIEVTTATPSQLIFNSNQDIFKIVQAGTTTITVPNASNDFDTDISVTHNLGFVPGYVAFITPPPGFTSAPGNAQLPWFYYELNDSFSATPGYQIIGLADVDDLTTSVISFRLSFVLNNSQNVGDWIFRYYLLQETATT